MADNFPLHSIERDWKTVTVDVTVLHYNQIRKFKFHIFLEN